MASRFLWASALLTTFAVAPHAGAAGSLTGDRGDSRVVGGEAATTCAWPTAVYTEAAVGLFGVSCSAVLIHPQLIATYGACPGGLLLSARFGEADPFVEADALEEVLPDGTLVHVCETHPTSNVTVCVLAEPVLDLPMTPIVYGCEQGILEPGRDVVMVGFGAFDDSQDRGVKHWGASTITQVHDDHVLAFVEDGASTCGDQDAGAPLFVQYPDGSWHTVGIGVNVPCGDSGSAFERLDVVVPWIEEEFGVDVTPCHDVDGTWAPGEGCGDFEVAGIEGTGTWDDWCAAAPRAEDSRTCGPASGEDETPLVWIEAPVDEAIVEPGTAFDLDISVNHPVDSVGVAIDGIEQAASDDAWPFGFAGVELPEGTHTLVAIAAGADGTRRESAAIVVHVGEPDEPDDTSGTESSSSGSPCDDDCSTSDGSSSAGDTSGDESSKSPPASDPSDPGGCACRSTPHGSSQLGALVLVALGCVATRRRRRFVNRPSSLPRR